MNDNQKILIESFMQTHPKTELHRPESIMDSLQFLSYIENFVLEESNIAQSASVKYYIKRNVKYIEESIKRENVFKWPYSVAPYFTPEEVLEFGEYYTEASNYDIGSIRSRLDDLSDQLRSTNDPDEIAKINSEIDKYKWSGEYDELYSESSDIKFEPRGWYKKITELQNRLKLTEDPDEINYIKQQMLNIGWNPEVEYNAENQIKAINRLESIYQEMLTGNNNVILDISSIVESFDDTKIDIIEESNKSKLKPISVVLVYGDGPLSSTISKVTNGPFSHSALCIDNDFNKLYSFNMDNNMNFTGGFSIESVEKYPKDHRLAVFTFFVKPEIHKKISEAIKFLIENIRDTSYSVVNILTIPFKHININMSTSMICSQFVDSMLKLANIDISNKDSSKVTPNDFYRFSLKNSKVYKAFDGITKDFNAKKVSKYMARMASKARPYTETVSEVSNLIADFIYPVALEAKLPIGLNKDGDIILTNKFIDFDAEYSSSHKLLLQYHKSNNLEGMKYELSRLYYINHVLERKLYHNRYLKNKEKNMRTRARVLNDFNKYLTYIISQEPDFNFAEYYESTVFYPHTITIKKDEVLKLKDIVNYIL